MNELKKILIIGENFYWGRSNCYKKAFKNLNIDEVKIIDKNEFINIGIINRIINKLLLFFNKVPVFFNLSKLNNKIIEKVNKFNPGLIFFIKPIFIKKPTLQYLKEKGIILFSWHTDDAFNTINGSKPFYKNISLYDCHFTTKSFNVDEFLQVGAKKSIFLPHAVNTNIHHPIKVSENEKKKLGADIIFIGTYANDKRVKYTERLCQDGYDMKIYGNDWGKVLLSNCLHQKNCIQGKPVFGKDFCKVISSSKIILAFLRQHNRDVQTSRTYEIPACGGFMLHERTKEATDLFQEGKDFFESYEEMKRKINYYLNHEKEREKISKKGYARVTSYDYSYKARAEKVSRIYNKLEDNV